MSLKTPKEFEEFLLSVSAKDLARLIKALADFTSIVPSEYGTLHLCDAFIAIANESMSYEAKR